MATPTLVLTLDKTVNVKPGDPLTATVSFTNLGPPPDVHKTVTVSGSAVIDGAPPVAGSVTYDLVTAGVHTYVINVPGFTVSPTNPFIFTGKA